MLESLLRLGKNGEFLYSIVKYPKVSIKKQEHYVVRIIFDLDNNQVYTDTLKYHQALAKKYLFIGNTFSAAAEKVARLTTDKIKYLIEKKDNNIISNIRNKIKQLQENKLSDRNINELDRILQEIEEKFIKKEKLRIQMIKHINGLAIKAVLYTICVKKDGKFMELATHKGYRNFLRAIIGLAGISQQGTCFVCGDKKLVLPDAAFPSGSLLKVWSKDKKGFTAGLSDSDEARIRSFAVCSDCRERLLKGWAYIKNNLKMNIEDFNVYLLPVLSANFDLDQIDIIAEHVRRTFGAVVSYEKLLEFEEALRHFTQTKLGESWYGLTVVFGEPETAHFRLLGMIQDVPITNLNKLREKMQEMSNEACRFLNDDISSWYMGFYAIYHLIPLRTDKMGAVKDWKQIVELFSSMLSYSSYPRNRLIESAVLLARIYRFQTFEGYNVSETVDWDAALCRAMIKFNYLLKMLIDMGVVYSSGGEVREDLSIDEGDVRLKKISEWVSKMGYSGLQQSLFMLGYLIGEVGYEQYKKQDEKKSILDKIDFKGMKAEKVISLSNQILKSLRDYRILKFNEKIYYLMIELLNRYMDGLRANPVENTFYILSGYAFSTYNHLTGGISHG